MTAAASRRSASHAPPVQAAIVVAGVVAMAAASRVAFPIGPIPITLQTYALFALAGVFGGRLGLFIVATWLAAAAFGLPVLAGGAGGWKALTGTTAGYLLGMAAAAYVCGEVAARARGWIALAALFVGGHLIILAAGWAGLALTQGASRAFESGVLPLLPGAAIKSLAAALTVRMIAR